MMLSQAKQLTETKFIKPADDKCFDAKVYRAGGFHPPESVSDDYPVLVSDPVEFDLEYRTFVGPHKTKTWYNAEFAKIRVLSWSNYVCYDHLVDPKYWDMIPAGDRPPADFVNDLLHDIEYHDWGVNVVPSVIDVGRIKGKGWAVIETNPAWASGLYGCDPGQVLKVLENSSERLS